ncbi:unnamed protein product [Brassica oleracea var. botrytis]
MDLLCFRGRGLFYSYFENYLSILLGKRRLIGFGMGETQDSMPTPFAQRIRYSNRSITNLGTNFRVSGTQTQIDPPLSCRVGFDLDDHDRDTHRLLFSFLIEKDFSLSPVDFIPWACFSMGF